jgi:xylitol oxidase
MRNWAGNYEYQAAEVLSPTSVDELRWLIARSGRVRALGSRHSFTDIADSDAVIDTQALPERFETATDRRSVTVNGSMGYGRLAMLLRPERLALHNLASLPHISIAGAIATGTHGSGVANQNLGGAVRALELATADGELIELRRGEADFDGAVVSLGAFGVVTAVTLDVEAAYNIAQRVYNQMPHETFTENIDAVLGAAYSVSGFTRWDGMFDQIWVKSRLDVDSNLGDTFLGAVRAVEQLHPIRGVDPEACTIQIGEPGLWSDRLPHFKLEFTPSVGKEIQSEFFVERSRAAAAVDALAAVGDRLAGVLLISEVRTIAADELWLSPHQGRDTVAFHFTWIDNVDEANDAATLVGQVLADFDARTHWGKVFEPGDANLASYERLDDFLALVDRLDPNGVFRNRWFERIFGATAR